MSPAAPRKPVRWQGSEPALRAVQVAFDVEEAVMEAIRVAAFHANVSTSTQIRSVLNLPVAARPKPWGTGHATLAARHAVFCSGYEFLEALAHKDHAIVSQGLDPAGKRLPEKVAFAQS